ncbi:MAG: glycosyltransferase [Proteobacteria bacterium]|nr:glycosyltransferase [Pseudomonadota bacterium]
MHPEVKRAIDLHAAGRIEEAKALSREHLVREPSSVAARCVLAAISLQFGEADAAAPLLHQACALEPSYPPVHYYLSLKNVEHGEAAGVRTATRRAKDLLDRGAVMAERVREITDMWRWLDAEAPVESIPPQQTPADIAACEWLFVWRDLGEMFYHFDLEKVGHRRAIWLPVRSQAASDPDPTPTFMLHVGELRPDVVALLPGTGSHRNVNLGAFSACRRAGIPTILVVPDQRKRYWQNVIASAATAFDLVVSLDGCSIETLPTLRDLGDRFFRGWTPIAALPAAGDLSRPFLVNMVGSLWGARSEAVDVLRRAGIDVLTRPAASQGGERDAQLPPYKTLSCSSYYELLQRSRIAVNFSASSTGDGHQLKGRVFEAAACGALLLESANDVTSAFFRPGEEFVYFHGLEDLVDKVRFYREHPEMAAGIASRARQRFLKEYAATHFWRAVLDRARRNNRRATDLQQCA